MTVLFGIDGMRVVAQATGLPCGEGELDLDGSKLAEPALTDVGVLDLEDDLVA